MNECSTHNKSFKAQSRRVPLSDQQFAQASLALIQGWRQTFVAGSAAPTMPSTAQAEQVKAEAPRPGTSPAGPGL